MTLAHSFKLCRFKGHEDSESESISESDHTSEPDADFEEQLDAYNVEAGQSLPQVIDGRPVWQERWGITREQLKELLERLRQDPAWDASNNVYTLVADFLVPWTAGSGLGYALQVNRANPKEISVFVSHWMGETAEDFLETVVRATSPGEVLYICALANYQAEDGAGPTLNEQLGNHPSKSPFRRVLTHLQRQREVFGWPCRWRTGLELMPWLLFFAALAIFCVPSLFVMGWPYLHLQLPAVACLCTLSWMLWRWLARTAALYAQRMVAVPTGNGDIYGRLWVVYEIFIATALGLPVELAPTMARAGKVSSRDATCSFQPDVVRIRSEIEASDSSYDDIDAAVRKLVLQSRWYTVGVVVKYCVLILLPGVMWKSIREGYRELILLGLFGYLVILIAVTYGIARQARGIFYVNWCVVLVCSCTVIAQRVYQDMVVVELSISAKNVIFRGLLEAFLWDLANVCSMLLATVLWPLPSCFFGKRRHLVLAALFAAVAILRYYEDDPHLKTFSHHKRRARLCRGDAIAEVVGGTWLSLIPIYVIWAEFLHWGIKVVNCLQYPRIIGLMTWAWFIVWIPVMPLNDFLTDCVHYLYKQWIRESQVSEDS